MDAVGPGTRLAGRYVVVELLATGGMATVWRARDEVLARTVAVKVLREELAGNPEFRERFRREAVAAARLNHPAIISIFDTGVDGPLVFIVMEFFAGRTLAGLARERGPVAPRETVELVSPVLEALGYAHGHGIVHRDVKPANILVGDDNWVKVTDFGIAKAVLAGADLTTTGKVLGTAQYLSPEQVEGRPVDARSDLYSTGAVLYELLTGRPPFDAETPVATAMMRLNTDPIPPRDIRPTIPRGLEAVTMRALARRPEDRFASADAMRTALGAAGEPVTAPVRIPAAARPTWTRRMPIPATGRGGGRPPESVKSAREGGSGFRSWGLVPLVVVALAVVAIVVGLALGWLKTGGPLGVRRAPGGSTGSGGGVVVNPVTASAYDPFGDGSEHSADTGLAVDGNPNTAWFTDHYSTAAFGNLKPGLGLWIDLGNAVDVERIMVTSPLSGWSFQILPGDSPNENARPLVSKDGEVTFTVSGGKATVELQPTKTRGFMIWITRLAPDQGRFAAAIAEVSVRAAS